MKHKPSSIFPLCDITSAQEFSTITWRDVTCVAQKIKVKTNVDAYDDVIVRINE